MYRPHNADKFQKRRIKQLDAVQNSVIRSCFSNVLNNFVGLQASLMAFLKTKHNNTPCERNMYERTGQISAQNQENK